MAEITAAAVKALREQTGLPMMDCKKAFRRPAAIEKPPSSSCASRAQDPGNPARPRNFDRPDRRLCRRRAGRRRDDRTEVRKRPGGQQRRIQAIGQRSGQATGHRPRRATAEELLGPAVALASRARRSRQQKDDLINRIREVFKLGRIVRIDGPAGGYAHHDGTLGVLVRSERRQRRSGQGHRHARRRP